MNFQEIIARKRDGGELGREEIWEFVQGAVTGRVPDVQLAAMLMAICIRGASPLETQYLVEAMTASGERWELGKVFPEAVDKHSTGGVGDTVSLVFAPWLAACGVPVAMMAGAGLGHSQGTLDKLSAIPGFVTAGTRQEAFRNLNRCGVVFARQSEVIVPADRKLYALRDVTATVPSLPLIVASIMSKKLAVGASRLVLDVKCGSGAFRKTLSEAQELARALVDVAFGAGVAVKAVISAMDQPLGPALGCAEEVREALACLQGRGDPHLLSLSRELVILALQLVGKSPQEAGKLADEVLASGRALALWERVVEAHGGNPEPQMLPAARYTGEVRAAREGYLTGMDGEALGWVAVSLGAGRRFPGEQVDPASFLRLLVRIGDRVEVGQVLARFGWSRREVEVGAIGTRILQALSFGDQPVAPASLVLQTFG